MTGQPKAPRQATDPASIGWQDRASYCHRAPPAPNRMTPMRREDTPSMEPRAAASQQPDPEAVGFIRFCYERRRVGWPELYDEMCAVAARGLYRGYGSDDLAAFGIGFSLFEMPSLAAMSARVVAEEQARRRPVSVRIRADVPTEEAGTDPSAPAVAVAETEITVEVAVEVPIAPPSIMVPIRPQPVAVMDSESERPATPTVRLALAPTGA